MTAQDVLQLLGLEPLPGEGGFYRETYRSAVRVPGPGGAERAAATAIYFLLTPDSFSALHRLPTAEVYHFYLGDCVELLLLPPGGPGQVVLLGTDLQAGQRPQVVVPAGAWQGSRVRPGGTFALLGTTVAPGFEFCDFEPGAREELLAQFPDFTGLITALTR